MRRFDSHLGHVGLAAAFSAAVATALLAACSSSPKQAQVPEPPTLKSLASRVYPIQPDPGVKANEETAARAYQDFLGRGATRTAAAGGTASSRRPRDGPRRIAHGVR